MSYLKMGLFSTSKIALRFPCLVSLFASYYLLMCFSLGLVSSKEADRQPSAAAIQSQPEADFLSQSLLSDEDYLRRLVELEKQLNSKLALFSLDKRAQTVPFSGGVYGKRASRIPFSGGVYGKRANAVPFSGGVYGKRAATNGIVSDLSAEEPLFLDRSSISVRSMPLNGGLYG